MPSCITAFHVTCAFDHGLEMRTILADNDEVKFKSFCQEHSDGGPRVESASEPVEPSPAAEDLEKVTLRKQRLQQLEEDFYELVEPAEVAERLDLAEVLVDFIYQYWKLKRKANANQPLLTPKTDEVDNLAQQEQDVLYRRLRLFTHLRQDLERVSTPVARLPGRQPPQEGFRTTVAARTHVSSGPGAEGLQVSDRVEGTDTSQSREGSSSQVRDPALSKVW